VINPIYKKTTFFTPMHHLPRVIAKTTLVVCGNPLTRSRW